jgi:glycosyltransferase involved in cell wall biosynthesis
MPEISVIICAHNPRRDYLSRTLDALKAQSLPREQWELLLIDNASKEPLANSLDLSWHPGGRHVLEKELGLTPARFRGIREAAGDVLVFVDDDNVLESDYLENALKLTQSHTFVGAFGGSITGDFETKPEPWADPVLPYLALYTVAREEWAFCFGTRAQFVVPCGAGMVIRKTVAGFYANRAANDPLRRGLDRKGASLASAGDIDMALCSCACGLAIGRFPQLRMTHIIPARRLQRDYLLRLYEESIFSDALLQFIWDTKYVPQVESPNPLRALYRVCKSLRNRLKNPVTAAFNDDLQKARLRGFRRAARIIRATHDDFESQSNWGIRRIKAWLLG